MVHSGRTAASVSEMNHALSGPAGTLPPLPETTSLPHNVEILSGAFFWRRLFARCVDLVFVIPIGIVLCVIAYIPVEIIRALTASSYTANLAIDLILGHVLFLVSIVLHDATFLALFRTTIGKSLFGIKVTKPDGSKPRFRQAARRTERMLRAHFYLIGFPILMWPFVVATFSHIKRTGSATWDDRSNTVFSVRRIGAFRIFVAGTIGVVLLMTIVILDRFSKDQTKAEFKREFISEMRANLDAEKHPPITYDPARYTSWETVSVPDICTFQIPPSMELQAGKYRAMADQIRSQVLEVTDSANRVIAQQKGLNALDPMARSRYARIIVETEEGSGGDYPILGEPLSLSRTELSEMDSEMKAGVQQEMAQSAAKGFPVELRSWDGTRVVRVNGVDGLLTEYTRSVKQAPPVFARIYMFMNNDRMHRVSVSYRMSESNLWADDLDKVITTFQFTRR